MFREGGSGGQNIGILNRDETGNPRRTDSLVKTRESREYIIEPDKYTITLKNDENGRRNAEGNIYEAFYFPPSAEFYEIHLYPSHRRATRVSVSPANRSAAWNNLPLNTEFNLVFTQDMIAPLVEQNTSITDAYSNPITVSFIWQGKRRVTLRPKNELTPAVRYTIRVELDARDTEGDRLAEAVVQEFYTTSITEVAAVDLLTMTFETISGTVKMDWELPPDIGSELRIQDEIDEIITDLQVKTTWTFTNEEARTMPFKIVPYRIINNRQAYSRDAENAPYTTVAELRRKHADALVENAQIDLSASAPPVPASTDTPVKSIEQVREEERSKARSLQNTRVSSGNDFMQAAAGINALSTPGTYRITLTNSVQASPVTFSSGTVEKTIIIRGSTTLRTIINTGIGNLFTVGNGNTLVLERNIKLDGNNKEYHAVLVNEEGALVMKKGSHIEGAKVSGVYVNNGGRFTMEGGMISGNTAQSSGGGVCVNNSTFTMSGGTISGNMAQRGSGVYISNGMFTMSGGNVNGNTAQSGGSVAVFGGRFTMEGGTISENMVKTGGGGGVYAEDSTFTVSGGNISRNTAEFGGGVYVSKGMFTMSRGTISGNTVNTSGGGVYTASSTFTMFGGSISKNTATWGGGVYVSTGTFTMSRGIIDGNTANSAGGGVYLNTSRFTKSGGTINGTTNKATTGNVVYQQRESRDLYRNRAAGSGVNMDSNVSGEAGGWEYWGPQKN
jgi:hypothetical protein